MNISKVYFLIFSLLFFSCSCTITKRVHRKGWHVEWHHSLRKSQDKSTLSEVELETGESREDEHQSDSEELRHISTTLIEPESVLDEASIELTTSEDQPLNYSVLKEIDGLEQTFVPQLRNEQIHEDSLQKKTQKEQKVRTAISPAMMFIIALIVAGLAFLVGLGFYFLAQNAVSTFWLVLAIIGISFFWLLALTYLVAGIIALFSFRYSPMPMAPAYSEEEPKKEQEE